MDGCIGGYSDQVSFEKIWPLLNAITFCFLARHCQPVDTWYRNCFRLSQLLAMLDASPNPLFKL